MTSSRVPWSAVSLGVCVLARFGQPFQSSLDRTLFVMMFWLGAWFLGREIVAGTWRPISVALLGALVVSAIR